MSSWGAPPNKESNDKFFKGNHGTPWNRDLLWINRVDQEKKQMEADQIKNSKRRKNTRGESSQHDQAAFIVLTIM